MKTKKYFVDVLRCNGVIECVFLPDKVITYEQYCALNEYCHFHTGNIVYGSVVGVVCDDEGLLRGSKYNHLASVRLGTDVFGDVWTFDVWKVDSEDEMFAIPLVDGHEKYVRMVCTIDDVIKRVDFRKNRV